MNKVEFYAQLPKLMKRLFTWGVGAAALFLLLWYRAGFHNLWGYTLDFFLNFLAPIMDIHYEAGTVKRAAFISSVAIEGKNIELNFLANPLNTVLVEVVTLIGLWPHQKWGKTFRLIGFCFLFTILYQSFNVGIQLYANEIGPSLANRLELYYEPTWWHTFIAKLASFDKLILRFWAGFPIFLCALMANFLFEAKFQKSDVVKK